jgi:hypothetical protein
MISSGFTEAGCKGELYSTGSELGPVSGPCEHSGSINSGNLPDQLNDHHLLGDSVPRSCNNNINNTLITIVALNTKPLSVLLDSQNTGTLGSKPCRDGRYVSAIFVPYGPI